MPPLRVCYGTASVGFACSAVGAAKGAAPPWPNTTTWVCVAVFAAVALATYAVRPSPHMLSLATATVVVASTARVIGWALSTPPASTLFAAVGVWMIVGALMFIVHVKASRLRDR